MLTKEQIINWLKEKDQTKLEKLWQQADRLRIENVGDEIHLRGLLEISNYCQRHCAYCGINGNNRTIERYRMSEADILEAVKKIVRYDYGTVVMQSGEDRGLAPEWLENIIKKIKTSTNLALTLSLGQRSAEELAAWRRAGADRYLMRFETSNAELYRILHPTEETSLEQRLATLKEIKGLGYEAGSGVMIGIPGQSWQSLAEDLLLFAKLDLDMIGVGPYIAHPQTDLAKGEIKTTINKEEQVTADELTTYKVIAITRILCPEANIPSTTALATLNKESGRELGLQRGANVVMPNVTPPEYRIKYEIYPDKACIKETAEACFGCLQKRIKSIARKVAQGPGNRIRKK